MLTILAGLERVKPSGTEAPDFDRGPTNQTVEAETCGRKDPGNGGGHGRDVRAVGAQMKARPAAVGNETGTVVADPARSLDGVWEGEIAPLLRDDPKRKVKQQDG